ncbi:alpha/beta fold hydrolase [uncultured Winogradskyella sp.]|uniref:alpha/beta hydrolase family protein n=1 Tax=uncultured Winogradskyella sp. TaxID=395353 RepID=UPI002632B498|nr:alpha/beta fold hydrolase [uncultured Winogradskyella sp.]
MTGRFEGALSRDGSIQLLNFNFSIENGIQKGTYEIPEAGLFDVPIEKIAIANDTLNLKFFYGNFYCFINKEKKQITGNSEKWNPKIRLHVKKVSKKEKPYKKENIVFNNKDVQLSGMIYHPTNKLSKPVKYVILIHGSGAQDRYSPYYISLGYALSKKGIGVLLYDKRGTGKSTGNFKTASLIDLAEDAVAAYDYLRSKHVKNISEIGLLGTSQGGWIAPIASNKIKDCDFLILNVGPSVSVFQQDIHRVKYSMKADGWNRADIDSAVAFTKLYFQFTEDSKPFIWEKLEQQSISIKEKDWVEYVNIPKNKDDFKWWRNNNFNPETTLKNLNCRTLCLFGEYDPLVPPKENKKLMTKYLTLAGIEFDIKVISGTLHDMKTFQGLNGENWKWPEVFWEWRIEPRDFIDNIAQFINKN